MSVRARVHMTRNHPRFRTQIKNRFRGGEAPGGYRDVNVSVMYRGLVCEVQARSRARARACAGGSLTAGLPARAQLHISAFFELKEGARVMLIKNDPEGRWVNGTLATVAGFSGTRVIVEIDDHVYEIEPTAWEKYRYELDPETKKVKREVVGTFKQMPLRLAYAVTIHKAQGLTLDKVFIDFDSGMFAHGQAYVAFSRARSLDGLSISRELRPRDLVLDREAFAFGKLDTIEDTDAYLLARFAKADGALI